MIAPATATNPAIAVPAAQVRPGDRLRCGAVSRAVRAVALTLDGGATLVLPAGAKVVVRRAP